MFRNVRTRFSFFAWGIAGALLLASAAQAATYHVRADGLGNNANDGLTWATALATLQAAVNKADLGNPGGCTKNATDAVHTIKLAATTGAQFYSPAGFSGAISRSFDLTVLGGFDPLTDTQTGVSLIRGAGIASGDTGIFFNDTGCAHGTFQTLSVDRVDIADVSVGIWLKAGTTLDAIRPKVTFTNGSIVSGGHGLFLDYDRVFNGFGPTEVNLTNAVISAGQDPAATVGAAVRIKGPTPRATVTGSSLTSGVDSGLHLSHLPRFGSMAAGGTFVSVTSSDLSNCAVDGIHYENVDNPPNNFGHYQNASVPVTLDKVRLTGNGRHGVYVRTFVNSQGGWLGGNIIFTATNCLIVDNIADGVHLQGDFINSNATSRISATAHNDTIANNGGDGINSTTSHTTSGAHDIRNTILAGNGGDALDFNNNGGAFTLTETFNDFFGNTGSNIRVNAVPAAPDATDFLTDPFFSNQLPEIYQLILGSPLLDAGDAAFAPADDLLGVARAAPPSLGAFEDGVNTLKANPAAVPNFILLGQSFTLSSAPSGGVPPYAFLWTGNNIPAGQELVEDPGVITPTLTGNLDYTVRLTDSLGNVVNETVTVTVATPDLAVTKSASTASANPGDTVTYTVNVANNGLSNADNVVLTDTLPAEVTFVPSSSVPAPDSIAGPVLTYNLGTLAPTASVNITINVTLNASTEGLDPVNTATATTTLFEVDTSNNTDTATVHVNIPPTVVVTPAPGSGGYFGDAPFTLDLDGSASNDPDPVPPPQANTFFWDFGNGDTSTLADPPPTTYTTTGTFVITVTVTDKNGGVTVQTINVLVGVGGGLKVSRAQYFVNFARRGPLSDGRVDGFSFSGKVNLADVLGEGVDLRALGLTPVQVSLAGVTAGLTRPIRVRPRSVIWQTAGRFKPFARVTLNPVSGAYRVRVNGVDLDAAVEGAAGVETNASGLKLAVPLTVGLGIGAWSETALLSTRYRIARINTVGRGTFRYAGAGYDLPFGIFFVERFRLQQRGRGAAVRQRVVLTACFLPPDGVACDPTGGAGAQVTLGGFTEDVGGAGAPANFTALPGGRGFVYRRPRGAGVARLLLDKRRWRMTLVTHWMPAGGGSPFGVAPVLNPAHDARISLGVAVTLVVSGTTYAAPVRLGRTGVQFSTGTAALLAP